MPAGKPDLQAVKPAATDLQTAKLHDSSAGSGQKGFQIQEVGISGLTGLWTKWAVMGSYFPLGPLKEGTGLMEINQLG